MDKLQKKIKHSDFIILLVLILIMSTGVYLRYIHLTADPPSDLTISGGVVGDPGQYSLGARNKLLFGKWAIKGWKTYLLSPVVNYFNIVLFKIFGINLYSQRLIPFTFSVLTLILLSFYLFFKVDKRISLIFSVLYSINYVSIMYSKIANREFPMIFFFVVSMIFFVEAEDESCFFYFISSIFFVLSFLSKGSIIYFLVIFGVLTVVNSICEFNSFKKILSFFWVPLFVALTSWYILIFKSNKSFFMPFVKNNSGVRSIHSLKQLVVNIFSSPFLSIFKEDSILIVITVFLIGFAGIVYFLELTSFLNKRVDFDFEKRLIFFLVVWFIVVVGANSVVSYRPTRFYVNVMIPVILIFSFFVVKNNMINKNINIKFHISLFVGFSVFLLILSGVFTYVKVDGMFHHLLFSFLVVIVFLFSSFYKRKFLRVLLFVLMFFVIIVDVFFNSYKIQNWSRKITYKINSASNTIGKLLPTKEHITGNWASILTINTKHKTYFMWPGLVNWSKDFIHENKIKHLIVVRGRFVDELKIFKGLLKEDMELYKLVALFNIYNSEVFLFSKFENRSESNDLQFKREFEVFSNVEKEVVYDEKASGRLAAFVKKMKRTSFSIKLEKKIRKVEFRVKGRMKIILKIPELNIIRELIINSNSYKIKKITFLKPVSGTQIILDISPKTNCYLDYLKLYY